MSSLTGPLSLRTSIGRLAVTGAATLVTVTGFAPAAVADDELAPESSTLDPSEAPAPGGQQPEPAAQAPASDTPTPEVTAPEPPADDTTPPPGGETPEAPVDEGTTPLPDDDAATDDGVETPVEEEDVLDEEQPPPTDEAVAAAATLTLSDDSVTATSGRTVRVDVLGNDSSSDRIRSLTVETRGAHVTPYVVGTRGDVPGGVPGRGSLAIELDADAGYVGPDSFTYRVTTEDGTTAVATVTVDVQAPEPVTGNFGSAKFRVGVQAADGSYLPAGTTPAGSVFRIEQRLQDGTTTTTTCTTAAPEPSGASFCPGTVGVPGATYTITQQSAPDGLVASSRTRVVDPCEEVFLGLCFTDDVVFVNAGSVLPVARDDDAASSGGGSVDVDVLANDDSEDPQTTLAVEDQPLGGTAEVVGSADRPVPPAEEDGVVAFAVPSAGTQRIRYTPVEGFEGLDTFTYRLTNGNGAATAMVSVSVSDNGAVTPVDPTDGDDGDDATSDVDLTASGSGAVPSAAGLPSAGGPDARLLVLGGALLLGGTAAVAGSRRRRDVTGG
jgi:hypothetical protein